MDIQVEYLLTEALKLPANTREDLVVRLMNTVEPDAKTVAEVKQAWVEEIDSRVAKLENGQSSEISIEEAWPKIAGKPWRSQSSSDG